MANLDFLNEAFKNKIFKSIFICGFLISLVMYVIFGIDFYIAAGKGEHAKFLGIERNMDKIHDTVTRIVSRDTCISKAPEIVYRKEKMTNTHQAAVSVEAKDNSHTVTGNNNTVGVNGDVNVNTEHEFGASDKSKLSELIKTVEQKENAKINCVNIFLTPESNGKKYASQLLASLRNDGYSGFIGTTVTDATIYGVNVRSKLMNNCLQIDIGILK